MRKRRIQIYGEGCDRSRALAEVAEAAAQELQLDCEIQSVTDAEVIAGAGVKFPPALAVDGQVQVIGHVPRLEVMKRLLHFGSRSDPSTQQEPD